MSNLKKFFRTCPSPSRELGPDELSAMVAMMLNARLAEPMSHQDYLGDSVIAGMEQGKVPSVFTALWTRNDMMNGYFRISLDALMFMALFIRNKKDAAIYFSYVAYKAKEAGTRDITLRLMSEGSFALGTFTPEETNTMWEGQKNTSSPNGNLLDDPDEWRTFLYGDGTEGKVMVRFSEDDERMMSPEEVHAIGAISEPRAIEGRTYFWAGGQRYLSVSMEDFEYLQNK